MALTIIRWEQDQLAAASAAVSFDYTKSAPFPCPAAPPCRNGCQLRTWSCIAKIRHPSHPTAPGPAFSSRISSWRFCNQPPLLRGRVEYTLSLFLSSSPYTSVETPLWQTITWQTMWSATTLVPKRYVAFTSTQTCPASPRSAHNLIPPLHRPPCGEWGGVRCWKCVDVAGFVCHLYLLCSTPFSPLHSAFLPRKNIGPGKEAKTTKKHDQMWYWQHLFQANDILPFVGKFV